MHRLILALISSLTAAGLSVPSGRPSTTGSIGPSVGSQSVGLHAAGAYSPPVTPMTVLRGFDPPTTAYGAGHLGVDLAVPADGLIHAAADATVSFAGQVAGRGVVVLAHADGIRTEYEPVQPLARVGDHVLRGQVVAVLDGAHRGCAGRCLHWGARRGAVYLDPLTLLRPLGPVRLLPWRAQATGQ